MSHEWRTAALGRDGSSDRAAGIRLLFDGYRIGFGGVRDLASLRPTVSTGPGTAALKQTRCERGFRRAMKLFDGDTMQADIVYAVVLNNTAVARCVGARRAMCLLVTVLDMLVDYFKSEIARFGLPARP